MRLEDELRRAFQPEEPADGFAERVAARIAVTTTRNAFVPTAKQRLAGMAMVAAVVLAAGSTLYLAHRRQVAEAERVRSEAMVGLRIASAKLNEVHTRLLQRIGSQNERLR
jgi:hypothetical protein